MNILFFLTPKSEVIYVNEEDTVGQAMDTMESTSILRCRSSRRQGVTQEH